MGQTVCLIPARRGSKRLPRKATAPFHGRELAAWTFDFVLSCPQFGKIVLSTDDPAVEAMAPATMTRLARPAQFADDQATLYQVIKHVIEDLPLASDDIVALTPVTAPLRKREDLDHALQAFHDHDGSRTVLTVCANPHPPHLLWTRDEDGSLKQIVDRAAYGTRKQAFAQTYFWNDAFLIDSAANFLAPGRDLYGPDPVGVVMPRERSVPIDHPFDLWLASHLFDPSNARKEPA
ncbi:MAG: acylneuraminate cytidylyltransferase family protein [Alphaproteobacteria bacterium]|nr:acylneuraminate cytidylyltransferase family protein [Alphaproteobacteria bacterium]